MLVARSRLARITLTLLAVVACERQHTRPESSSPVSVAPAHVSEGRVQLHDKNSSQWSPVLFEEPIQGTKAGVAQRGILATPLAAQSTRDTAAIRVAAANSGEGVGVERIVADTAWTRVFDPRQVIDIPFAGPGSSAGTAVRTREMRLERRGGKWVRRPAAGSGPRQ